MSAQTVEFAPAALSWNLLATAIGVVLVMAGSFAIGAAKGKFDIIDAVWGPGFVVIAIVTFIFSAPYGDPARRIFLLLMVAIWGLRLGGFIYLRNRGKPEDPRYEEMVKDAGKGVILRRVQLPQGIVMWIVSLTVQVGMFMPATFASGPLDFLLWLGVVGWLIGVLFESIGDAQLLKFKNDPANKGKIMDRGCGITPGTQTTSVTRACGPDCSV